MTGQTQKTFRASNYQELLSSLFSSAVFSAVFVVGVVYMAVNSGSGQLIQFLLSNQSLLWLLLVLSMFNVILSFWVPKYKIVLDAHGNLTETLPFFPTRTISTSSVTEVKWGFVGVVPTNVVGWILIFLKKYITKIFKNTPGWVGIKYGFAWGPTIVNSAYPNFPRFAIDPDIVKELKVINVNMKVEIPNSEIIAAQEQRNFPLKVMYFASGIFILLISALTSSYLFAFLALVFFVLAFRFKKS